MFRKKSHAQVIGEELQEGLAHIGSAVSEAGRATAEHLGPRYEAAAKSAHKTLEKDVAPRVEAAVAAVAPRLEAARDALEPQLKNAQKVYEKDVVPRLEAARDAAAAGVATAVATAGPKLAEARDTAGPKLGAAARNAQKTLEKDVAPRVQAAVLPRYEAARDAAVPALAHARESVVATLESARGELGTAAAAAGGTVATAAERGEKRTRAARKEAAKKAEQLQKDAAKRAKVAKKQVSDGRSDAVAAAEAARDVAAARVAELRAAAEANRKAVGKKAEKLSKKAEKRRKKLARTTAKATKDARKQTLSTTHELAQRIGVEKKPRRWPWLLVALGVGGVAFAAVRRATAGDDPWTPAPTGDGPVPTYREDPVPSSPSTTDDPADESVEPTHGGEAVSTAEDAPGDATPEGSDLGWRDGEHHDAQSTSPDAAPQVNPVPTEETLNKPPLGRE
ncbi:hypothetical protein [Klenkia sp. PcliD-1-E]|uniref:hypothetical protein n=1 Tax=Klenkia sp. PcliD-1-E TaxID=2954492 RepID=UPI0020977EBB|nr:hypothetical protein [Klenkia sp. PcliD-1-E]MCO7220820.1 hypothetical protein [Klenkia sp. PcliD-1-E]